MSRHVVFQDAMQAVTRVAVREARLKEIKQEMLNSQKLKVFGQLDYTS